MTGAGVPGEGVPGEDVRGGAVPGEGGPVVGPVVRDESTAEFFDAAADEVFLLRRCLRCQAVAAPQAGQCGECGGTALGWQAAAGGASVVSWTVTHGRPGPGGSTPTAVLVIAELDEGPWWWGRLVNTGPARIRVGTRLRIGFERAGEGYEPVPVFRLA